MPNYKVLFPDRVKEPSAKNHGACCMVTCGVEDLPRGVEEVIFGQNERDVWDKLHREFPFERCTVLGKVG